MHKTRTLMVSLLVGVSFVFSACDSAISTTDTPESQFTSILTSVPLTHTPVSKVTNIPNEVPPTLTPYDNYDRCYPSEICLRWFVGLSTGTDSNQVAVQEAVVYDVNSSRDRIHLLLRVIPHSAARDVLNDEIASGNGPDIIGPMTWAASNDFDGQWLDLSPYITSHNFDTSIFDPALVKFYQTDKGQMSLPFAVYPGGMFFVPAMFDKAGLAYPPQTYGEKYRMPNGRLVDWNWETVEKIAKLLTLDVNGKNATEAGFDRTRIVQVGYNPQWQHPNVWGTYDGGAGKVYQCVNRHYQAAIPDTWKKAWQRHYAAMWGNQPWMPTGPLVRSPEFGVGADPDNVFNRGKVAMVLSQTWFTCCLADFAAAGNEFQVGIIPMSTDGSVHGYLDAETFYIWKGTPNPDEAFDVLAYLITRGGDKLLPTYGGMSAIASKMDTYFQEKSEKYPFVTQASWDVFKAGLTYSDTPSAESWMPNFSVGFERIQTFGELMDNTPPEKFDFEAEFQKLEADLTAIFKGVKC